MNKRAIYGLFICTLLTATGSLHAATTYINDRLLVGIHQEKSVDSVILRLVPTGTPLEVLKAEANFTQVRDPDGISGWVDNQYLVNDPPSKTLLQQANLKIRQLESELSKARLELAGLASDTAGTEDDKRQDSNSDNQQLEQQYKAEKIRTGELQAEVISLKNRLSALTTAAKEQHRFEELIKENRELAEKHKVETPTNFPAPDLLTSDLKDIDWQKILIILGITLLIGFILGLYVLDLIHRHRHGGFRL